MSLLTKAKWISKQLTDDDSMTEDCYDVLLGNITQPTSFVDEVMNLATDYDSQSSRARFERQINENANR